MQIDLRQDFAEIYAHLTERVQGFDPAGSNVLGEPGSVKIIEIGYEYSQSGWVVVTFDMRPDAAPDGEWTMLIEGNELERPHWLEAGEVINDEPIDLVRLDGSKVELSPETELAEILGEMIKAVVIKARSDGIFNTLPKSTNCELGVEHFGGFYAWPIYEERGQENLAGDS